MYTDIPIQGDTIQCTLTSLYRVTQYNVHWHPYTGWHNTMYTDIPIQGDTIQCTLISLYRVTQYNVHCYPYTGWHNTMYTDIPIQGDTIQCTLTSLYRVTQYNVNTPSCIICWFIYTFNLKGNQCYLTSDQSWNFLLSHRKFATRKVGNCDSSWKVGSKSVI